MHMSKSESLTVVINYQCNGPAFGGVFASVSVHTLFVQLVYAYVISSKH